MNKKLSQIEVFAVVLGSIIGWGSFMLPGTKFLPYSGVINTAIGLLLGVGCIGIIERSYRMMLEDHCQEGGEFSYVYKYLGRNHGFVVGWFLALAYLTMIPLNATAFPLVMNKLFEGSLAFGYLYTIAGDEVYLGQVLVALVMICFFALLNLRGIKETGKAQAVIISVLVSCVIIIFIGMLKNVDQALFLQRYVTNYTWDLKQILSVFAITPFLFVGFDAVPQLAKNMAFSAKKASRLAIVSLVIGMLIYNMLNITTGLAYGPSEAANKEWALGSAVMTYIGKGGFFLLVLALGAAVSSGINGFMICASKLLGAMGEEGIINERFGRKNTSNILSQAIVFVSIISFVAVWFGRQVIGWIVDMSSLGASIAYFYVCLVTAIRHTEEKVKHIAWLGVGVSTVFIMLLTMPFSPAQLGKESFVALVIWCGIGIRVGFKRKRSK